VGSNESSGSPLKGRGQAKPVWVDLGAVFGRAGNAAQNASDSLGIVTDQLVAGGLSR
jgi:hypothetical protein